MYQAEIGFIGGGNMAGSIISGVVNNGYDPGLISVVDPVASKLEQLGELGVKVTSDVNDIIDHVDILVFAVKPQSMSELAKDIQHKVKSRNILLLSIVSGVRVNQMESWFGSDSAIIRIMPNTPALLKCGASAMYANENVANQQKEVAEHLLRAVGAITWVKEERLIDVAGAISGSGPAYYFLMMELIRDFGVKCGLTEKQATLLTTQTAYGASRMALETSNDLSVLRQNVTSKGGITAAALNTLEQKGFKAIMEEALQNNLNRSEELADMCVSSPQLESNHKDQ